MAGNHLREPLDYLYEELPPEKMAEARRHLSECPECRAQMRTIRETVKIYRQAEHPIAPVGLSARTIKNALKIARDREQGDATRSPAPRERSAAFVLTPSGPPEPAKKSPARIAATEEKREIHNDAEYARLKEEVLGEVHRRGWRNWLFHPAWTVAASVIFLCALLMHFSPRMHRQETVRIPVHREGFLEGPAAQLRQREKLPASTAVDYAAQPPAPEPPPILQEAAALNEAEMDFPPAPPAAPLTLPRAARIATPASAPIAEEPEEPVAGPEPAKAAAPAVVSLPPPIPARVAAPDRFSMPIPDHADDAEPAEPVKSRIRAFSVPVFPQPPAPPAEPEPEPEPEKPAPARPQPEKTPEATAPAETAAPVLVVDGLSPDDVPQIVERPTPIDTQERIRSLTALIGMQIVSGEFDDARVALDILGRYDEKAATELRKLLLDAPEPKQDKVKAVIGSSLPEDAPMPVDKAPPPVTPTDDIKPLEPEPAAAPEAPPSYSSFVEEPIQPRAIPEPAESVSPPPEITSPLGVIEPPEDPPLSKVIVPPTFEVLPESAPPDETDVHETDETPITAADEPPPFSTVSIPSVMEPATFPDGFVHLQKSGDRHGVWVAVGSTPAPATAVEVEVNVVEMAADPIPVIKPQPVVAFPVQPRIIVPAPARRLTPVRPAPPSPKPYLRDY